MSMKMALVSKLQEILPLMIKLTVECNCACHDNKYMFHCGPCCRQCPYCSKNIVLHSYDKHKEKCAPMHSLDVELGYFDEHREEWCKDYTGKFAVIKGVTLKGFYDTSNDAYAIGYDEYGLVSFLIKEVQLIDKIVYLMSPFSVRVLDE